MYTFLRSPRKNVKSYHDQRCPCRDSDTMANGKLKVINDIYSRQMTVYPKDIYLNRQQQDLQIDSTGQAQWNYRTVPTGQAQCALSLDE